MRTSIENNTMLTLKNGLIIKGSYKACLAGMYVDLFIVDAMSNVVARKSIGYHVMPARPDDILVHHITDLADLLMRYKIDQLTSSKVIFAAVPAIVGKLRMPALKAA